MKKIKSILNGLFIIVGILVTIFAYAVGIGGVIILFS